MHIVLKGSGGKPGFPTIFDIIGRDRSHSKQDYLFESYLAMFSSLIFQNIYTKNWKKYMFFFRTQNATNPNWKKKINARLL